MSRELERAEQLRCMYEHEMREHQILSRAILDAGRAVFTIGRKDTVLYFAEIAMLSWGTVHVHGDIGPVVFGGCSSRRWEEKLRWLAGTNWDYAMGKACIGMRSPALAEEYDDGHCKAQLVEWRRRRRISRATAREGFDLLDSMDIEEAQRRIQVETYECGFGKTVTPRVVMAQVAITKLGQLLDAEHLAQASMTAEGTG